MKLTTARVVNKTVRRIGGHLVKTPRPVSVVNGVASPRPPAS